MAFTRREFALQAAAATAIGLMARRMEADAAVALQPLAAQVMRLMTALRAVGSPLSANEVAGLQRAMGSTDESHAVGTIQQILDAHVLMEVNLNPEARVSVRRGGAAAVLVQAGWSTFLVKVNNEAGVTAGLTIRSPQGGPMGRRSSLAIEGVHDFTNGAVDAVEARNRWIAVATYDLPPMTATLSGLALEYRILQVYSRDAGEREASLQADCGFGEQDLGFRSTLPVLFHCLPARAVRFEIFDEHGKPVTASLRFTDALGRIYPAQGKRELPDLAFEPQIYRAHGEILALPEGEFVMEAGRGPEYLRQSRRMTVTKDVRPIAVLLQRWVTPASLGYYSGDTHIHAAGCSHYESPTEGVTPEVMTRQVAGEALDLGAVLNWGPGFAYQKQFFSGHVMPTQHPLMRYDVEVSGFPSSHCGHLVLLRLQKDEFPGPTSIDDWPSWNLPILRWAKAQGAVTGYAHIGHGLVVDDTAVPNYEMPPFNSSGANEFLVDVTHDGVIDFLSGCDLWPFAELNVWYHTLNCGFRTAFAGETDFPCITDECVGGGRSYVHLPGGLEPSDAGYTAWLQALVRRDAYFGDGRSHIFGMTVESGATRSTRDLRVERPGEITVAAQVCARLEAEPDERLRAIGSSSPYAKPYWHVERARVAGSRQVAVELIVNGESVERVRVTADGSVQAVRFRHIMNRSGWVALRVYPSCHTNPIFVEVGNAPVRCSARSARWCRQAVDVLWEQKRQRIRPTELAEAAAAYQHARLTYDAILAECREAE